MTNHIEIAYLTQCNSTFDMHNLSTKFNRNRHKNKVKGGSEMVIVKSY